MEGRFISEPIQPVAGAEVFAGMAQGGPGLPMRFRWRHHEYAVARVIRTWRETTPCDHGSNERYVRKHWFHVETDQGSQMKIYFERRARSRREMKIRWWLHTLSEQTSPIITAEE